MGDNIITSYTQTQAEAYILDISEVLDLIRKTDIKLLGQISIGGVATQKKHSWLKDEMDYEKVQATNDAAGALVIGETTLTLNLAARHDLRLRVGSIIKDKAVGKDESLMVTNIATVSPYTITVTVWPGGGAAGQDHAQAADYRIISSPIKEGASPTDSAAAARTMASNYIQLFERGISITDETKNLKMRAVSDEEKYQIEKKTWSLKRELGFAVLYGKQHEPASVDEYGTLGRQKFRPGKTLCCAGKSQKFEIPKSKNAQTETISREESAWLAGIIEGEGNFNLHKLHQGQICGTKTRKHDSISTWIVIDNTDLRLIQKISQIYVKIGIKYHYDLKKRASEKHRFGLRITTSGFGSCRKLIRCISEFLASKKDQAELMLQFIELREKKWQQANPNHIPFRVGKNGGFAKITAPISYGEEEWDMQRKMQELKHRDFNPQRLSRKASLPLRDEDIVRAYK